jgi:hypothetical protein
MKDPKLSGREMAVLKAIDFASGTFGNELASHTQLEGQDLLDILSGLMDVGYVEAYAGQNQTTQLNEVAIRDLDTTRFEINPSYALQIKQVMKR